MKQNNSFMDRATLKRIKDIENSILEIEDFTDRFGKRFDVFCNDRLFFRGIQMNIAIIGEAMNQILRTQPEIKISSARKIVDTRNYVIHGYDSLSPEILWNIVINHLPILKAEIANLIGKES